MFLFIFPGLSRKKMINFSNIHEHQDVAESIHKKLFQVKQDMATEDPLSTHGTGSHEAVLVSEITSIINDENIIIALEQGKKPVSILNDEFFDEQAFP